MSAEAILSIFPNLTDSKWVITSPEDYRYNCIAWAAGDTRNWWQPSTQKGFYWPHDNKQPTLESYIKTFTIHGYSPCESDESEEGYEKVALYVDEFGMPSHAARQKESGAWTSKLGELEDVEHDTLHALEGDTGYGKVARILKRPRRKIGESK